MRAINMGEVIIVYVAIKAVEMLFFKKYRG